MNVLDPFEVVEIEMWPFFDPGEKSSARKEAAVVLARPDYTVYQKVLRKPSFRAVLNEKDIPQRPRIKLPPSQRSRIVPDAIYEFRKHPDVRLARRASTIEALARVISEGAVSAA